MSSLTKKYLEKLWEDIEKMDKEYINKKIDSMQKDLSPQNRTIIKLTYKIKSLKRNFHHVFNQLEKLT